MKQNPDENKGARIGRAMLFWWLFALAILMAILAPFYSHWRF